MNKYCYILAILPHHGNKLAEVKELVYSDIKFEMHEITASSLMEAMIWARDAYGFCELQESRIANDIIIPISIDN